MIDRLGISIFWLFLGCVKALVVLLDMAMGAVVWIAGESDEQANRDRHCVDRSDSAERGTVGGESDEKGDWN